MATTDELLTAVDAAIEALLGRAPIRSYRLPNGQQVEHMSLSELRDFRKALLSERASSVSTRNFVEFGVPE